MVLGALTRSALDAVASDAAFSALLATLHDRRLIVATTADIGYVHFAFNWIESVKRAGIRAPLVLCLDEQCEARLNTTEKSAAYYSRAIFLPKTKNTDGRLFNTAEFSQAVRMKTLQQHAILKMGYDLLFTDVDAPWAADLRPFLFAATRRERKSNLNGGSKSASLLLQMNFPNNDTNPGVFYARSTPMTTRLFELTAMAGATGRVRSVLGYAGDDQQCLNFVLACGVPGTGRAHGCDAAVEMEAVQTKPLAVRTRKCLQLASHKHALTMEAVRREPSSTRYFELSCSLANLTLLYGVLPPLLFRSGAAIPNGWPSEPKPLLIHANFRQGHSQKLATLKSAGLWFLDDDNQPLRTSSGRRLDAEHSSESPSPAAAVAWTWPPRTDEAKAAVRKGFAYLSCRQTLQLVNGSLAAPTILPVEYAGKSGPGGIGSMLQDTAMRFLRASKPTAITGDFRWYTSNKVCAALGTPGMNCFFRPVLVPPSGIAKAAACTTQAECKPCAAYDPEVPQPLDANSLQSPSLLARGGAWWWGVTQAYLFRPNAQLLEAVEVEKKRLGLSDAPAITVHLRRADKLNDKFSAQKKRPLAVQDYFAAVLRVAEDIQSNSSRSLEPEPIEVFFATDSSAAAAEVVAWALEHRDRLAVRVANGTHTRKLSALDGASQAVAHRGYATSGDEQYELALEALTDLLLLSSGRTLMGLCMSQLARLAAALGFARGNLRDAVALDPHNIPHKDAWKYGVHEGWRGLPEKRQEAHSQEQARSADTMISPADEAITQSEGIESSCWKPPPNVSAVGKGNAAALEGGAGAVYADWASWRWGRAHCPHDRGWPANAKLRYDNLPAPECADGPGETSPDQLQLSVLVQGYKAPASLNHSFTTWQRTFLAKRHVSDVIFFFNARNASVDDRLVHRLMESTLIPYTILGDSGNHNLGYTITRMLDAAHSELVLFLEKDWYVPAKIRQGLAVSALAAAAAMVRFTGVDFVRLVRSISVDHPEAAQWICGTPAMLFVCSASRWAEWSNNPFVARASWVRARLRWVAEQNDPLLYGCHHKHKANHFIDIEELFHRRVLPWTASNWVVASFLDRGAADRRMLQSAAPSGLTTRSKDYPWYGIFAHRDVDGHYVSY